MHVIMERRILWAGQKWDRGDEVDLPHALAIRLIKGGRAVPVRTEPVEKAIEESHETMVKKSVGRPKKYTE